MSDSLHWGLQFYTNFADLKQISGSQENKKYEVERSFSQHDLVWFRRDYVWMLGTNFMGAKPWLGNKSMPLMIGLLLSVEQHTVPVLSHAKLYRQLKP